MNTYKTKKEKEKRLTCNYNYIELVINKTMMLFFSNKFSIVFVVDVIGFPTATAVFFGVFFCCCYSIVEFRNGFHDFVSRIDSVNWSNWCLFS